MISLILLSITVHLFLIYSNNDCTIMLDLLLIVLGVQCFFLNSSLLSACPSFIWKQVDADIWIYSTGRTLYQVPDERKINSLRWYHVIHKLWARHASPAKFSQIQGQTISFHPNPQDKKDLRSFKLNYIQLEVNLNLKQVVAGCLKLLKNEATSKIFNHRYKQLIFRHLFFKT